MKEESSTALALLYQAQTLLSQESLTRVIPKCFWDFQGYHRECYPDLAGTSEVLVLMEHLRMGLFGHQQPQVPVTPVGLAHPSSQPTSPQDPI